MPIWYWTTRGLNKWADQNDIETITRRINGGKNELADRIDYVGRCATSALVRLAALGPGSRVPTRS